MLWIHARQSTSCLLKKMRYRPRLHRMTQVTINMTLVSIKSNAWEASFCRFDRGSSPCNTRDSSSVKLRLSSSVTCTDIRTCCRRAGEGREGGGVVGGDQNV